MSRIDFVERNEPCRSFLNDYDVTYAFDNDRSTIMSRIDYVERNEPCRSFLNIFQKIVCVHCIYLISMSL